MMKKKMLHLPLNLLLLTFPFKLTASLLMLMQSATDFPLSRLINQNQKGTEGQMG